MTTTLIRNIRDAYERGERDDARRLCNSAINGDANMREGVAEIAALAIGFLDYDTAKDAYAHLLELTPDNLDDRNLFATTLIQAGEFDEAEAQLRQALKMNNAHSRSYFNLSRIHTANTSDPLIDALEKRLADPTIPLSDQYACRLALAKFYDDIGDYDKAFEQYSTANRSPQIKYDHNAQVSFFERLKGAFSSSLFAENKSAGDPSSSPVFLIGMPRSGSSLLETMLSRDPRIAAVGERIEMTSVIEDLVQRKKARNGYLDILPTLSHGEFYWSGAQYCERVKPLARGADHLIDKNLLNFLRTGFIHLILPNATIIHLKRNPVDTCLSCFFQPLDPAIFPFTFDLAHIGQYYGIYADLMAYWEEVLPGRVVQATYEDLIADPEPTISTLYTAIGLLSEKALPQESNQNSIIATASAWQARQPLYDSFVGRWKHYKKHLGPLFEALEEASITYGET